MSTLPIDRKRSRRLAVCAGLLLIATGAALAGCGEAASEYEDPEAAEHHEPAKLKSIEGTDVKRVVFSAEGAERVGLQTARVRASGQQKVIPYAAVIYDPEGDTFAYTSPEPRVYIREKVKVSHVDGDRAVLAGGPPPGTKVVTVGAAEVYGTEFEVAH
jgi:hypothetical protein